MSSELTLPETFVSQFRKNQLILNLFPHLPMWNSYLYTMLLRQRTHVLEYGNRGAEIGGEGLFCDKIPLPKAIRNRC